MTKTERTPLAVVRTIFQISNSPISHAYYSRETEFSSKDKDKKKTRCCVESEKTQENPMSGRMAPPNN